MTRSRIEKINVKVESEQHTIDTICKLKSQFKKYEELEVKLVSKNKWSKHQGD